MNENNGFGQTQERLSRVPEPVQEPEKGAGGRAWLAWEAYQALRMVDFADNSGFGNFSPSPEELWPEWRKTWDEFGLRISPAREADRLSWDQLVALWRHAWAEPVNRSAMASERKRLRVLFMRTMTERNPECARLYAAKFWPEDVLQNASN